MNAASIVIDPDALKYVLSLDKGRAVIWDILRSGGLFRSPFNVDSRLGDFNAGAHNQALIIYADCMAVSPDLTALMIREQGTYDNGAGTDTTRSGDDTDRSSSRDDSDEPTGLGLGRLGPTALGGD
jgi:hypothetical protein